MNNTLFVLLDGAEDDPNPLLGGKKPIEVARMPFLRSRATYHHKTTGRAYTHLFLNEFFTGHSPESPRAAIEALGLGLDMDSNRTAYRLSPAEIRENMIIWSYNTDDFRDALEKNVMDNLGILEPYSPDINFFLNGRAVLTMECDEIPDLPGPPVNAPFVEVPGDLGKLVMRVADIMNGITDYPWGCGRLGRIYPGFRSLRGMTAISDSPTSLGVCASLGHKIELIKDLDARFPVAAEALKHGNVFLHIDEVDEYSHQKDPFKKIRVLEHTDDLMKEYFSDAERIVYFADHGTSCVTGEHIITNVPVWTTFESEFRDGELIPLNRVIQGLLG
ncbi:MAG: 2,3-bisphosphoglycerate-independent phosphoglycerate mutase [Candidatus Methanomethylophilaceae archaeon]|nr:2,3-bisphosphoglycerate-independent phosphoglycerate mutase [Candidatus Methanomethylophilaceae archaeon]